MRISWDKLKELWILDPGKGATSRAESFEISCPHGDVIVKSVLVDRPRQNHELYGKLGAYIEVTDAGKLVT